LLVGASQHSNRKLRDIAADVTTTGRLPLRPTLTDELLIRVTSTTVDLPGHPSPPPETTAARVHQRAAPTAVRTPSGHDQTLV
jgi:hypothetical protein